MAFLLVQADSRRIPLADGSVHCVCTSPPYFGLRSYLDNDDPNKGREIGLESSPAAYVAAMVTVFREVRRILRDDGTVWCNLGDGYAATGKSGGGRQGERWAEAGADYTGPRGGKWCPAPAGLKPKDRMGIPHRLVFALQDDGWYWRDEIIWAKPNPMPESVTDRTTKAHEFVFLLTKRASYWYDAEAVKEASAYDGPPKMGVKRYTDGVYHRNGLDGSTLGEGNPAGRNLRSVWSIATTPYPGAHFATMPPELASRCIKAGSPLKCCPTCGRGWERIVERGELAGRRAR
jgi:DNA modification methylase